MAKMRTAVQSRSIAGTRVETAGTAQTATNFAFSDPRLHENATLAVAALIVLGLSSLILAPLYGVLGAAIAVAIATLFWLVGCAVVLDRLSGLRTDALYLIGRLAALRSAPA